MHCEIMILFVTTPVLPGGSVREPGANERFIFVLLKKVFKGESYVYF